MSTSDRLQIAVRAYTERAKPKRPGSRPRGNDQPSRWSIVFDTETTTDAAQQLRFGAYQIREGDRLAKTGLFFDPTLDTSELETLRRFAINNGFECHPLDDFVHKVLLRIGYDRRGTVVGFNLPFDISRLAMDHAPARRSMRGGFTFKLSKWKTQPRVRVKHLNRAMALIDFATPGKNETARASRKRGLKTPKQSGFFVDVATVAAALLSQRFTLAKLCERLETVTRKHQDAEHGAQLTEAYLEYACADVQVTWECFVALRDQYGRHALSTPLHRVLSEASVGKAYLKDMGVTPFLDKQRDFPRSLLGLIMSAYFGGRSEVRWRRTVKRVLYCDFKSMYPTVNALMGLWRFVIASEMRWAEATQSARDFISAVTVETMADRAVWKELTTLVRVRPDHDLFPVRARYSDGAMHTIGLNYLTCGNDLWVTMADCVAAKVLSGKAPEILEAIHFKPGAPQEDLKPVDLFGDPAYRVDPAQDDVFARIIDLRDDAKAKRDRIEQAIKIIANATSYGIFIEVQRDDLPAQEGVAVYGASGSRHLIQTKAVEQPGRFFYPLLGVLITGAARLMLALAERKVLDAGLDWALCDTDSLAIVKPDGLNEADFEKRANGVVDYFKALNPYKKSGSILKIEDINFLPGTQELEPLYCFAISAKRYALFNLDDQGRPIIRKASAHGLGQFVAPYFEGDASASIPKPATALNQIGVDRWHYDLWFKIVEAALGDQPRKVCLDYHPALAQPALTRFGVSSPALERWMETWNAARPYAERVKPFGFMITFQPRRPPFVAEPVASNGLPGRGRPPKRPVLRPVAPFNRTSLDALARAFDRETGEPILADQLKTYSETLAQYHLHPEDKFLNGDYWDSGRTERRHVFASGVRLVGKEANKWEENALTGEEDDVLDLGRVLGAKRPLNANNRRSRQTRRKRKLARLNDTLT